MDNLEENVARISFSGGLVIFVRWIQIIISSNIAGKNDMEKTTILKLSSIKFERINREKTTNIWYNKPKIALNPKIDSLLFDLNNIDTIQ